MKEIVLKIQDFLKEAEKPLVVILGPTASGKTALSVELAKEFNGEIVSADSRQIYRGLDISTAKISKKEQGGVPHHLIDVADPDEVFTLADYQEKAFETIDDILRRGKTPFLVGGTGLYISAITENYQIPKTPQSKGIRLKIEKELEEKGAENLYERLKKLDPEAVAAFSPNNHRYLIRALEIVESTKKTKTELAKKGRKLYDALKFGIYWSREKLYERIDRRTLQQIESGLIEEVQNLVDKYSPPLPAMTSIGCKEVIPFLEGKVSKEELIEKLQQNNRNYAKRQLTWFRRDPEINWVSDEQLRT
ncbi:MAG TPA: tRNA (adenosine(37)-N6)-dimethylallyltransferase MiaA [Candidatus Peregrinibacteria bacterium]|nr:tRNA (adenosine(37)-N6)-dimethylallyltransferase MiaA [Candidatus Peregrinibacteria bacterium]